jgi:hypothetical protein
LSAQRFQFLARLQSVAAVLVLARQRRF